MLQCSTNGLMYRQGYISDMDIQAADMSWRVLIRMTRPGFLMLTLAATVLGLASAAACGCGFDVPLALGTVALACLAHAAGNVLNDYHDAISGADAANRQGVFPFTGGSRLIQQGQVSVAQTRSVAWTLMGLVVLGGLLLAVHSGPGVVVLGVCGLVLAWAYSAPPLKLMSRGAGELTVALVWWMVMVGADYVQRQHFFLIPAVNALSFGLLVANILLINGVPDAEGDRAVGKRTLAVRLGPTGVALLYSWLAVLAHAGLGLSVWALVSPLPALWGLASAPLSLLAAYGLWRDRHQPQRLKPALVLTVWAAVVHALAMAAGLASMAWA